MSYAKGDEVVLKWNSHVLVAKLTANFDGSVAEIDTTNDSSAGFKESLPGDVSGAVSFSAVYDPAATAGTGIDDLIADALAKTVHTLTFGGNTVGNKIFSGQAYINKFSRKGQHGDKQTGDVSFVFTGQYTYAALTA